MFLRGNHFHGLATNGGGGKSGGDKREGVAGQVRGGCAGARSQEGGGAKGWGGKFCGQCSTLKGMDRALAPLADVQFY